MKKRRPRAEVEGGEVEGGEAEGGEAEAEAGPTVAGGLVLPDQNLIGPGGMLAALEGGPTDERVEATEEGGVPADLGATKYVHAAFFAAAVLLAFLSGKTLGLIWGVLSAWPAAVHSMPFLLRYSESQRSTFTLLIGVGIALAAVIQTYRRQGVRQWADEVALELSRVTWPNKETVTNGTIVVIVAGVVGTVYIALLDRFWAFVTAMIYGA